VPVNAAVQPGPQSFDLNLTEFSITAERRQAVDFSAPYYEVTQAVVTVTSSRFAGVTSIDGLTIRRAAVTGGFAALPRVRLDHPLQHDLYDLRGDR
jgi:polar amino acid transport system substrate-binding protein